MTSPISRENFFPSTPQLLPSNPISDPLLYEEDAEKFREFLRESPLEDLNEIFNPNENALTYFNRIKEILLAMSSQVDLRTLFDIKSCEELGIEYSTLNNGVVDSLPYSFNSLKILFRLLKKSIPLFNSDSSISNSGILSQCITICRTAKRGVSSVVSNALQNPRVRLQIYTLSLCAILTIARSFESLQQPIDEVGFYIQSHLVQPIKEFKLDIQDKIFKIIQFPI